MKIKIFLYLLAGIVVLALAGIVLLHLILPGKVTSGLQKEVARMLEGEAAGLYQIEIPEVKFSPLFRTMYVSSVLLTPDSQALAALEPEVLPSEIFNIQAAGLELSTGGLIALVRKKDEIVFSNFQINEFSAMVIRNPAGKSPEKKEDAPLLRSIEIKSFAVAFNSLKIQMLEKLGSDVFSLDQGRFSGGFFWQTQEGSDAPMFDLREPDFLAANLDILQSDGLHRIACDSLVLTGNGARLELFGIEMIPLFNKQEFSNQITIQTDRIEASLDTVLFTGFDLNKLINQKYLSVEKLELSHGRLEVFRDRHLPFNSLRRPLMPVRLIQQAAFQMWLGITQINDLDIFYQELPEGSAEEGEIPFRNLSATLTNMTNAEEHLIQDSLMRIEARARVFGRPSLNASFVYNLRDINGGYSASGTLTAMPFETINPAIYPLTGMRVIAGAHEQTRFSFTGNDFRSNGELTIQYSGLSLDLAPDRSQLRQNITNWAGRQFVYHSDNPGTNGELRLGTIDYERLPDRFVFHYWWHCFLSGAKSTVLRDVLN